MIHFFDYIYFQVRNVYSKTIDSSPQISGIAVVSLMQCINVISLIMILSLTVQKKYVLSKKIVILYIALVILNYVRYIYKDGNSYDKLKERYVNGTGTMALLYIVFSTVIGFSLAIYLGQNKF
jgi:hypothetical protein